MSSSHVGFDLPNDLEHDYGPPRNERAGAPISQFFLLSPDAGGRTWTSSMDIISMVGEDLRLGRSIAGKSSNKSVRSQGPEVALLPDPPRVTR
jgi:hypothetical protein